MHAFHLFTPFPSGHELDMTPLLRNPRSLGDAAPDSNGWSLVLGQEMSQGLWNPEEEVTLELGFEDWVGIPQAKKGGHYG